MTVAGMPGMSVLFIERYLGARQKPIASYHHRELFPRPRIYGVDRDRLRVQLVDQLENFSSRSG